MEHDKRELDATLSSSASRHQQPRRRATLKQTLPSPSGVTKLMSTRIWHQLGEQTCICMFTLRKKLLFDCTTNHLQQKKKKGTGIGIQQHADSSPHLNSTTGGNTHNALLDAFVLNWLRIGALTQIFSGEQVILRFSLARKSKGEMKGEEAQTHSRTERLFVFRDSDQSVCLCVCHRKCHFQI